MIVMHDLHQPPQGAASLSAGTYNPKQPADPANILVSAPFDVRGGSPVTLGRQIFLAPTSIQ